MFLPSLDVLRRRVKTLFAARPTRHTRRRTNSAETLEDRTLLSSMAMMPVDFLPLGGAADGDVAEDTFTEKEIFLAELGPQPYGGFYVTPLETAVSIGNIHDLGYDWDGDTVSLAGELTADSGSLLVDTEGNIQFTPATGYTGSALVSFYVTDGTTVSEYPGQIEIWVGNSIPEATSYTTWIAVDESFTLGTIYDLGWDYDGDLVELLGSINAEHGRVDLQADGMLVYTPEPGFSGIDNLTFQVTDGTNLSANTGNIELHVGTEDFVIWDLEPAYMTLGGAGEDVTVTEDEGSDETHVWIRANVAGGEILPFARGGEVPEYAPEAYFNEYWIPANTSLELGDIYSFGWDPDGSELTFIDLPVAEHGAVSLRDDGQVIYTPDADFTGTDVLTYTISDGTSSTVGSTTLLVGTNTTPEAINAWYWTTPGQPMIVGHVKELGWDRDGDNVALVEPLTANSGLVAILDDGSILYTPAPGFLGEDIISFSVTDGINTVPGTMTISVSEPIEFYPWDPVFEGGPVKGDTDGEVVDVVDAVPVELRGLSGGPVFTPMLSNSMSGVAETTSDQQLPNAPPAYALPGTVENAFLFFEGIATLDGFDAISRGRAALRNGTRRRS